MTRVSFSRVECWKECPRKYRFRYIDEIEPEQDLTPTNPLILGSSLDKGIQDGVQAGIDYYYSQYPIITEEHITEAMKMEYFIPKVKEKLMSSGRFQVELKNDRFIGYIDYLDVELMLDFKYSNHTEKYAESAQLSIYASELPEIPKYMAYMCIPKTFIRQKKDEDIHQFRKRVMDTIRDMEIKLVWMEYDREMVEQFWQNADKMFADTTYDPKPNDNCKYCEYANICKKPIIIEEVPKKRKVKPRSEISI